MVNAPATGQQRVPALAIGVLVLVILYLLVAQLRESPIPEGPASPSQSIPGPGSPFQSTPGQLGVTTQSIPAQPNGVDQTSNSGGNQP